jgi:hypothetical protein
LTVFTERPAGDGPSKNAAITQTRSARSTSGTGSSAADADRSARADGLPFASVRGGKETKQ